MKALASTHRRGRASRASRAALAVGFLAFALAVLAAVGDPATGYELSIYAGTTPAFWVGAAVATLVGVAVAVSGAAWTRRLGCGLAVGSVYAIVLLPILRGYHYYGTADPLTHLGWSRELAAGSLSPFEFVYPGIHASAVLLNQLGGLPIRQGLLLTTLVFPLVYVVFVALAVGAVAPDRRYAVAVGALSALLLLPVNHISMFFRTHPFSQTTMFAALLFFLVVVYVRRNEGAGVLGALVSPEGALLALVAAAGVLYHPQVAGDLLLVFVVASALQFVVGRRAPASAIADHARLYGPTAVFAVVYAAWVLPNQWFYAALDRHSASLVLLLQGEVPEVGGRVASQGASLLAIGVHPAEIFLKLFVPTVVFLALAGAFVLAVVTGRVDLSARSAPIGYFVAGAAVAGALIVVYVVGNVGEMYFRHLGVLMLFTTVIGAVGLLQWLSPGGPQPPSRGTRAALVAVFVVLLPLTGAVVYQSPYVYKANQHVTEQQATAYGTAFERGDPAYPVASVRAESERFYDSIYGPSAAGAPYTTLEGEQLPALGTALADGGYVVVGTHERQREVRAYQELRFTREQFESVDDQPGVSRVSTTGESQVYFVAPAES